MPFERQQYSENQPFKWYAFSFTELRFVTHSGLSADCQETNDMTPVIEKRRFLVWYGLFFVALLASTRLSLEVGIPIAAEVARESELLQTFFILAVLPMFVVMLSALLHAIRRRRFGWFFAMSALAFLGAYLYAYAVANNFWEDETE